MKPVLSCESTPALVQAAAARFGARPAVIDRIDGGDGDVTLSYAELAGRVDLAARALIGDGIHPGDRVAIWAPNTWEWIVTALGIHAAGAVLVPINTRYKGEEAAYVLARSGARALFTVNGFLGTSYVALLRSSGTALPSLESTIVMRGAADGAPSVLEWNAFLARGADVRPEDARAVANAVAATDLSDIIFTSGTTGHPKGVMATHGQSLRAFRAWSDIAGLREGDRYLVVNPFFHTFGYKAGFLASFMCGATVLPHAVFDVDAILARIARDRISVLPGAPALYQSILARPDFQSHDLSSLRLAITGAASIPVELVERMRADLKLETVLTAYGLTEGTGVTTMCREDDDAVTIASTSGRAIPGVEVRTVDDAGRDLGPDLPGEVVVRGYTVMRGYFGDPEATAKTIDADGWLHTGDIGVLDAHGNLKITDRKKDMFIVGGFNAYPAEIEAVLLRHEAIAQVAVVGAPDVRMGEVGVAFVVAKSGKSITGEELTAWSRERMANYKVPRRFEMVASLPTNATGKVLKFQLRERVTRFFT